MATKSSFVHDLIEGEADLDTTDIQSITVDSTTRGEAGEVNQELADLAQELREELAVDPSSVIEFFENFYNASFDQDEVTDLIDLVERAATKPNDFFDELLEPPSDAVRGPADWFNKVRAWVHLPKDASAGQRELIDKTTKQHGQSDPWWKSINPNIRKFENADPGWWGAWKGGLAEWRDKWPNLKKFREHSSDDKFLYDTTNQSGGAINIALFSDFGNGTYQAKGIARQLAEHKYSEVYHLGDVYYKGKKDEFRKYFETPLAPVLQSSRLFCLPENHELYQGGGTYHAYLDDQANVPHHGSYFCVRYPKHQVIGVDVNWEKRQHLIATSPQRAWLEHVFATGGDRTTILLTGSAPYVYGKEKPRGLLSDMKDYLSRIDFWFWGDNHYCALFDKHPLEAPFFGSCVGHGGFPYGRYDDDKTFKVDCLWVEKEARFPAWTKLRKDRGNNGWCQATLHPGGGVDLLYVDWLGAKRCLARFKRVERDSERHYMEVDQPAPGQDVVETPRATEGETFDQLMARNALHRP